MNRCGTCRHFGKPIEAWDDDACDIRPTKYHACDLITLKRRKLDPEALAYAQDGSDYHATLCVREEFGCAEWAPATAKHAEGE